MKRRLLSVFLSLCMILTLAPAAFAAELNGLSDDPAIIGAPAATTKTEETDTPAPPEPTTPAEEPAPPAEPETPTDDSQASPTNDVEQSGDGEEIAAGDASDADKDTTEESIEETEAKSPAGTKDDPFTTVEQYNDAIANDSKNGEDVYLTIVGTQENPIIFGTKNTNADTLADNSAQHDTFALTNTQSWANPPKLHLTLKYCEFYGNTANDSTNSSFMYLPNCQSLTIDNCKFDTGTSELKYGINWNLCGIQDSVVSITNSIFTGTYEKNALKLNQRNGADDVATDVKLPDSQETPAASIKSVDISGCTFSGTKAIIQLGSQGKGEDGAAAPSTGAFPVTISNVTAGEGEEAADVKVELAYLAANSAKTIPSVELSANETATKTENGDLGTDADFVAKVGEDGYISFDTALTAALAADHHTLTLLQDVTKDIKLPAGSTLTIEGNNKTLYGTITCAVASGEDADKTNTTLTLNNLKLDGSGTGENSDKKVKNFAVNSGEQSKDVVSGLILTMNNCEVQNYIKQCLYLTNAKELNIDGCEFTGGGAFGYIVDLNLVAVQNAEISITNSTFDRGPLVLSAIKVCARGKNDGTNPNDIEGAQASIKSLTVEGCTFSGSGNQSDIALGVTTKNGSEPNKSGSFPVKIVDNKGSGENGALGVSLNYKGKTAEKESVSSGGSYVGNGQVDPVRGFTITTNAGAGGTISPSGKVAVAENGSQDFTVIANSGYSISSVTVDGGATVERNANGAYTVKNVTNNCTVTATFSKNSSSGGGGGGGGSSSGSYAITVDKTTGGTVKVTPSRADKGDTVTITVDPKSGYELDKLVVTDKNGDSIRLTDKGSDKYTFTMPSGKVTVEATFTRIEQENETIAFTDVSTGAYYYDAVKWAVEQGITSGTSASTFSPNANCTRAQMVTFLWRANGSPKAAGNNPFTDVDSGAYYYEAVLWAVQKGITSGTSATTFAPDATVTRGQTVTLLYRANNSPAVTEANPFTDVAADAFYNAAVQWAAQEGITSGTSATTFEPGSACTRAQIVTFIFRDMVK